MRVAVVGAGAVGCHYGALLARGGHDVVLIGRAAHVDAITANGVRWESDGLDVTVPAEATPDIGAASTADLVLVCVKATATDAVGAQLAQHVPDGATVLSLQNGVDNAERLSRALPGRVVAAVVVYVAVEMAGPGHVRHHGGGRLVMGADPRTAQVVEAFTRAGVPVETVPDVRTALWAKLATNCVWNPLSALTDRPYGWLGQSPGLAALRRDILAECRVVAAADGIELPPSLDDDVAALATTMAGQRSSTAQDLVAARPSEIDHLNGYVVRRGDELGVPVPANRVLTELVRLAERMRDDD